MTQQNPDKILTFLSENGFVQNAISEYKDIV